MWCAVCRNRMRWVVALGVTAVLTAVWVGALPAQAQQPAVAVEASPTGEVERPLPTEEDFFYTDGRRVPVTIALNQVGLVARDGVSRAEVERVTSVLGLRFLRDYPPGILILELPRARTRPEIVRLARRLQAEQHRLIAHAGFVATPHGAEAPFVVTDEFIAQFRRDTTDEQIAAFNRKNAVEIVRPDRFVKDQYLLRVTEASSLDALNAASRYHESELTTFSHPNFVRVIVLRQVIPNDPLFGDQWHHDNTGQAGGTIDADVDTPFAWTITMGAAGTIIAVIDDGFDMGHPDLAPNLWTNAGEIDGNGIDDDQNGFVDDIHGCDYYGNDGDPTAGARLYWFGWVPDDHGTAVAGAAGARGNNNLGVSGSCPNCSLMLIRFGSTVQDDADAFGYAQQKGAHIITNSWGYSIGTPATTVVENAINAAATNGRGGNGCLVLFAMNNGDRDDCAGATPDISSLPNVIAVSASSNLDIKVTESAFGNCMDLLAPTHRGYGGVPYTGTLNCATTDRTGNAGYNDADPIGAACPSAEPSPPPADARDYTLCFGGTSHSAPLTAGVAGLVLSVRPNLTRDEVQNLLQDTADKIEDSAGSYAPDTGFSSPATGVATHGWGRVNAFEAVRVAAPAAQGGRGGVDIFLRDNRLDWGNTEQPSNMLFEATRGFIGHWRSMDIKVDAPPYQPTPTSATFDTFTDETPSAVSGDVNRVYVRVRNRGPATASSVDVKLHWTQFGTALPALPSDFWTAFPGQSSDTTQWHPLNCAGTTTSTCPVANLGYSGASVAGTAADAAQIVQFDFPAPPVDASKPSHFCLLAMLDSPQDRVLPKARPTIPSDFVVDMLTPTDNNVTHRNYHDLPTSRSARFSERFFVRNPTRKLVSAQLLLEAPRGWEAKLDQFEFGVPFELEPGEERLVTVQVRAPKLGAEGDLSIMQETLIDGRPMLSGITLQFRPTVALTPYPHSLSLHLGRAIPIGTFSNDYDSGFSVGLDYDYHFRPQVAAVFVLGYNEFDASSPSVTDTYWWNLSANLKYESSTGPPRSYVNGGLGIYFPKSGSAALGFNMGLGLERWIAPQWIIGLGTDYHRVLTGGSDTEFFVPYLRVDYRF